MIHKHRNMQARADSMRRFYESQREDIVRLQKRRAFADARYREARDAMRWDLAHVKRQEARSLHSQIEHKMRVLKSILHTAQVNQRAADLQAASPAMAHKMAAE